MYKACISTMHRKAKAHLLKKQSGGMLIMAVFIILVISLLATSLLALQRDSAQGTTHEVYAARAYLAAYSAGEIALAQLFPPGASGTSVANCSDLKKVVTLPGDSDTVGFHGCSAEYICTPIAASAAGISRYKIVSTAICQNKQIITRRQITLEASEPVTWPQATNKERIPDGLYFTSPRGNDRIIYRLQTFD